MKTHGVKQQKAAAKKKLQRSLRAITARNERTLKKLSEKNSASLASMRQMVERLGLSEAAMAAAVETDSPTLYGAEPPAV